jgi:tetratricopeptide (TPR) repeat protein
MTVPSKSLVSFPDVRWQKFGEALRSAREGIGFSRQRMANRVAYVLERMGHKPVTHEDTIMRWETAKGAPPDPHQVLAIYKVLISNDVEAASALRLLTLSWPRHLDDIRSVSEGGEFGQPVPIYKQYSNAAERPFEAWLVDSYRLRLKEEHNSNIADALFCAHMAIYSAKTDCEWAAANIELAHIRELNDGRPIEVYDEIIGRLEGSLDVERRDLTAHARFFKAVLVAKEDKERAIEMLLQIARDSDQLSDDMKRDLSKAMLSWPVNWMLSDDRYEECLTIVNFFLRYEISEIRNQLLAVKVSALRSLNRLQEALSTLDQFVHLDDEYERRARLWKAKLLEEVGRGEEAIPIYDHAIATAPWYEDVYFLMDKARVLTGLGRTKEALALYEDILSRESTFGPIRRDAQSAYEAIQHLYIGQE